MRKLLAVVMAAGLLVGGAGFASAAKGENQGKAGPTENNGQGLCTAYFNGQKNGHDKDGDGYSTPGPFRALEDSATGGTQPTDDDDPANGTNDEIVEAVYDYCQQFDILGNPAHGRFTCVVTDPEGTPDDASDDETECTDNPAPGKS